MSEVKLAPGKGAHWHLNGDTLKFICMALDDLSSRLEQIGNSLAGNESSEYDDEWDMLNELIDEHGAEGLFKALRKDLSPTDAGGLGNGECNWSYESDKFGDKLYTEIPWKNGAYRITLVCSPRGGLKLDVREWYNPIAGE